MALASIAFHEHEKKREYARNSGFGAIKLLLLAWLAVVAYTKHPDLMAGFWFLFGGFAVVGVIAIAAFIYFRVKERA